MKEVFNRETYKQEFKCISSNSTVPVKVYYFQCGWLYKHPRYHVIIEGNKEEFEHLFLTQTEFIHKFGINP
jgi:hypothetical protein